MGPPINHWRFSSRYAPQQPYFGRPDDAHVVVFPQSCTDRGEELNNYSGLMTSRKNAIERLKPRNGLPARSCHQPWLGAGRPLVRHVKETT
jgi:hypothetical protein